ncbi:SIS domain-containing protein [bacterium]|nr:SIS domain-containing protein [bacterium]
MIDWLKGYLETYKAALDHLPLEQISGAIETLRVALKEDRMIFVFGNGGSAGTAQHFVTDLGKGASDKLGRRFRCMSLNDNIGWITAIGNDYDYADIFVRQLENHAKPGDVLFTMSVSGSSPNLVKAFEWGTRNGMRTIALVGGKGGALAGIAEQVLVVNSAHYGVVEDAHLNICHLIAYAFMEHPELGK